MKKLLSVVLAALMIFSVIPFVLPQAVTATITDRIAYLDATNGDDDSAGLGNKSKAFKTFEAAYGALCPEGGTLVFTAPYTMVEVLELPAHYGEIVITADVKADDYWQFNNSAGGRLIFGGPVTIENIRMHAVQNSYIHANFNKLIIGEGVQCENTLGTALSETGSTAGKIAIMGGSNNSQHQNTSVTVNSGVWRVVVGGGRGTTKTANGTYEININGGYIPTVIGGNWNAGTTVQHCGGQAYITVSGGKIGTLLVGGQYDKQLTFLDSLVLYTGGSITDIKAYRTAGMVSLVYGGDVELGAFAPAPYFELEAAPAGSSAGRVYEGYLSGVKLTTFTACSLNVIPMATGDSPVIYVSDEAPLAGDGSEEHPLRYLNQAIAVLSQTGGTIKLAKDYTFTPDETTSNSEYSEFHHDGAITIDGQGKYSLIGLSSTRCEETVHNFAVAHTGALATYYLNGDTTFKDLTISAPRDMGIAANFNHLTLDNVKTAGTNPVIRLYGAVYKHYNHLSYSTGFRAAYASWSDKDTYISVTGESNDGTFRIYGFSRFLAAGEGDKVNCPLTDDEKLLHYPGTAHITVEAGKINDIFPAMIYEEDLENGKTSYRLDHTAAAAEVNIGGIARVNNVWTGGDANGCSLAGDLVCNVYGDCIVSNFGAIDNCDGTRYYNVNNNLLTYLKAVEKFTGVKDNISISSSLRMPVFLQKGFGYKNVSEDSYGLRASFAIEATEYFVENGDKYNIVEMGVLVKTATNTNDITYIKGKDFYPTALEAVEHTENYDPATLIAKSIVYVKDADINNYNYAGQDAGDDSVYFTAPITELTSEHLDMQFVFVPYVVLADAVDGEHIVYYGTATDAVSYNDVVVKAN